MPQPFTATRYHSLAVVDGTLPPELVVTSRTQGGVIMGLRHESAPIYGVQFHPESVLTEGGYRMLGNWLAVAGLPEATRARRAPQPAGHALTPGSRRGRSLDGRGDAGQPAQYVSSTSERCGTSPGASDCCVTGEPGCDGHAGSGFGIGRQLQVLGGEVRGCRGTASGR